MKTNDIFIKTTSKKLNESMKKTFGVNINLENFTLEQLEDARNKLRTSLSQNRSKADFNENVSDNAYYKTQWMLDTINKEIAERLQTETVQDNSEEITEGATDKAGAVVTAKTMVDRFTRWIEEIAGIENDTLLTLGDTIRDEMGEAQAKAYLEAVAPAIESALTALKTSRETLATGVRALTGDVQPAELLGKGPEGPEGMDMEPGMPGEMEPGMEPGMPGEMSPDGEIAPGMEDELNAGPDEFAVSEPAIGGPDAEGRAKRESIQFSSNMLRILSE